MAVEVNKRDIDTKFITLFADSRPDVDITFKDPVLTKSTNEYLVGVDNMTVCSTALSMIDEVVLNNHTDLIRIVRKPDVIGGANSGLAVYNAANAGLPAGDQTLEENVEGFGYDYANLRTGLDDAGISSAVQLTSVAQLMERLQTIAQIVNAAMSAPAGANTGSLNDVTSNAIPAAFKGYASLGEPADTTHLTFRLNRSGRLVIEGTKAFWSVCAIEIPNTQYQFGIYGSTTDEKGPFYTYHKRRYLTVNPLTATSSTSNMVAKRDGTASAATGDVAVAACNLTSGNVPKVLAVQTVHHPNAVTTVLQGAAPFLDPNGANTPQSYYNGAHACSSELVSVFCAESLYMGLDRRVGIELGTSLPIKYSPLVDHQMEYPDYIIGRWMFRTDNQYVINDKGENSTYGTDAGAAREYQGARDRVTYHALMPQNKLQVLRTKLFARVRKFSEATEEYGMRMIDLPTNSTDWWHARLHFVSKG